MRVIIATCIWGVLTCGSIAADLSDASVLRCTPFRTVGATWEGDEPDITPNMVNDNPYNIALDRKVNVGKLISTSRAYNVTSSYDEDRGLTVSTGDGHVWMIFADKAGKSVRALSYMADNLMANETAALIVTFSRCKILQ
jgi:hypothetical protein